MAERLHGIVRELPGVKVIHPRQANSVFLELPPRVVTGLRARGWRVYDFIGGAIRLMCSWDTTEEDVRALAGDLRELSDLQRTAM